MHAYINLQTLSQKTLRSESFFSSFFSVEVEGKGLKASHSQRGSFPARRPLLRAVAPALKGAASLVRAPQLSTLFFIPRGSLALRVRLFIAYGTFDV